MSSTAGSAPVSTPSSGNNSLHTTGSLSFSGATKLAFDPSTGGHLRANSVDVTAATVTLQPTVPVAGTGIVVLEATGGITGPITNFIFSGRGSPYYNIGTTQLFPQDHQWFQKNYDDVINNYTPQEKTNWITSVTIARFQWQRRREYDRSSQQNSRAFFRDWLIPPKNNKIK